MKKHVILACIMAISASFAMAQEATSTAATPAEAKAVSAIAEELGPEAAQQYQQAVAQQNVQTTATSQPVKAPKKKFWTTDKIIYGGNFGFSLDPNYYDILIMPEVGYQFFPDIWRLTLAPKYQYRSNMPASSFDKITCHTAGLQVGTHIDFVRFKKGTPNQMSLFFGLSYVYEHNWTTYTILDTTKETDDHFFDVGIGFRERVGDRSSMYVLAAWHFYNSAGAPEEIGWFKDPFPSFTFGFTY